MPNFAATWAMGFIVYCWWQALVLYLTVRPLSRFKLSEDRNRSPFVLRRSFSLFQIISQNILLLSPLQTAIRFIPMGPMGLLASYFAGWSVNHFKIKNLIIFGMLLSMISPIPTAVMKVETNFWASIFPSSILGVVGISIVYVSSFDRS